MKKTPSFAIFVLTPLISILVAIGSDRLPAQTSAAGWRSKADKLLGQRDFPGAANAFHQAAVGYRKMGDYGAYKVLEQRSQRYETQAILFQEKPMREATARKYYTGKRLEPLYGAYLGAFIDREDGIHGAYQDENGQTHEDAAEWNRIMAKPHAIFFMYMRYGNKFPRQWMSHLRKNGAAAQWVVSHRKISTR